MEEAVGVCPPIVGQPAVKWSRLPVRTIANVLETAVVVYI